VSSFIALVLAGKSVPIDFGDGAGMNSLNLAALTWDPALMAATAPGNVLISLGTSDTFFASMSGPRTDTNGFGPVFEILLAAFEAGEQPE
jgi:xylulokinase